MSLGSSETEDLVSTGGGVGSLDEEGFEDGVGALISSFTFMADGETPALVVGGSAVEALGRKGWSKGLLRPESTAEMSASATSLLT